jgi:hypothetical protein
VTELISDLPYRVVDASGVEYYPNVAAELRPDGRWDAWLEYVPADDSDPLLTPTETTQATRADIVRWANTLTETYVEGAFARAAVASDTTLRRLTVRRTEAVAVDASVPIPGELPDPFVLYAAGVATMRANLATLSRADLTQIIAAYGLNPAGRSLAWLTQRQLVTFIVTAVQVQAAARERPL